MLYTGMKYARIDPLVSGKELLLHGTKTSWRWSKLLDMWDRQAARIFNTCALQDFCIFWRKFNLCSHLCSLKSWYITGSSIVIRGTDYSFRVLLSIIVKMSSFSRRGFWRKRGRTGSYSQVISWTTVLYVHIRPPRHTHGKYVFLNVFHVKKNNLASFDLRASLHGVEGEGGVGFHHLC